MCDCFHLAFPNWHGAPAGTGAERRLRAPDLSSEDRSACDEPSQFTEGERPRPQGSSPVEDHPETEKYSDSDKEEDDPHHKRGSRKKGKKSAFGCGFDRRSTPKMSKLKEAYSPESGMIVKTAKDGGAEGLVYGGGGKEGIFIKEVVPESPASKSLQLKEGDQLLSATVYFDNVSYQDAIQILEHAQAYKVKLCLKRKPDITETEPLAESDIIPEDETFTPEMREHGKSKRRGDARISWPKFPSLGRGKKSRFARSHSSSEADEQRKLELSPPTSDTESPIKTQDALKGKKRHKMKLPSLTKRGRISSSEDQDTDEPTACAQEAAELISPEGLQSPMERRPGVHRIEQVALVEGSDARVTKPLAIQHKVELIAIDSALKTTDLTVALAGQDSPTGPLSPDGKKKKKERSELKMKMTGKDKSNKKEANAKSPKRLKTLGASLETAAKGDQPEHTSQTEQTSPLKGKGKTKIRTLLPKREDIEIPGMEDTGRTKVKGLHDELPETVQLSIDVDSVKEAVSKLPGYKLPKVDMCGVLIPEEITVIDANAQRISVKTPTKVADGRMKQEAPISKAEDTSTPELSKTSFKLPKIKPSDLTPEEVLTVTQMDQTTTETTQVCEPALNSKESDKISKTTKIGLPTIGFSKADFRMPDVGMYFAKPNISGPKDYTGKGERTIFLQEQLGDGGITSDAKMYKAERSAVRSTGELKYIDSEESPVEREVDFTIPEITGPQVNENFFKNELDVKKPEPESEAQLKEAWVVDLGPVKAQASSHKDKTPEAKVDSPRKDLAVNISAPSVDIEGSVMDMKIDAEQGGKGGKFKMPHLSFSIPKVKGRKTDSGWSKKGSGVTMPEAKVAVQMPDTPKIYTSEAKAEVKHAKTSESPELKIEAKIPELATDIKVKGPKSEAQASSLEESPSKFKFPTLKLPKFGMALPQVDLEMDKDVKVDQVNVKSPELKADAKIPELATAIDVKVKSPKSEVQVSSLEESPSQFKFPTLKLPKFGMALPQVDLEMGKHVKVDGAGLKSPEVKVEAEIPEPATDIDVTVKKSRFSFPKFSLTKQSSKESEVDIGLPDVDVSIPEGKMQITSPKVEFQPPEVNVNIDGPESKFKMPKFGISMPKMKGPDIDFSSSRKEGEIKLPETEVELPDVDVKLQSVQVDIEAPKIEARPGSVEGSPSKFKLPTIKLPKFGVALPQVSVGVPDMDTDIKVDGAGLKSPEVKVEAEIPEPATDIDVTVKKSRFSFPKFSLTKQSSKESEVDIGLPDVDGSIPEGKMQITSPKVEFQPPEVDVNIDGQESKFKMPKFGISMPKMKGPDIDFSLSRKEGEIKLPETEVELPDVDVKLTSVQVDIEAPKIEARPGSVEGSPSKFKLPTIKLPKLGVALPQVSVEVPDMDRDIKVDGTGLKSPEVKVEADIPEPATDIDVKVKKSRFSFPKFSLTKQSSKESEVDIGLPDVDVSIPEGKMQMTSPKVEFQPPEVDLNIDGPERKFKMPKFGISVPKMKGPDIDFSLSNKEGDIKLPQTEVELPEVDVNLPSVQVDIEAPKIEARPGSVEGSPSKFKLPTIKLPKLGVALPQVNVEVPVMDADIKVDGAGLKSPEVKVEAEIPDPATELDVKVKKSSFSFPKFSFTKQSSKESEVEIGLPDVDVSIPEGKMQIISPKVEFQQPKLDVNAHGDLKLPDSKITLPSAEDEIEVTKIEGPKSRVEGSPTKFKLPPFNLPTFGGSPSRVGVEVPYVDKDTESDAIKPEISEEEANQVLSTTSIDIEGQSVEVTTQGDELQGSGIKVKPVPDVDAEIKLPDVEGKQLEGTVSVPQAPKVEGDVRLSKGTGNVDVSPVSPSKFKLPSFKMPRLAFSRNKPEGQSVSPDTEYKDSRPEMKAELSGDGKSPQATSASFGVVLENLDVEFELPKSEKGEGHPETPKEEMERKDKQTKQEATKSPERTGWFRFPTFGLSSPSEPAKTPIKNDEKDKKSPFGEREEDMSPTCSARSSDIYADISSTATSEYLSLHSSSPTKVTVKYSNQNLPPDLGEMNILTSTAMSELITIEPNLPEKITILSSEVLSSSEETLRLASEKIHVVTSKVQADPESHRAKPLPTVQSTGETGQMSSSWTVESSQSSRRTVSQKRIVRETSRESTETFVITKQITKTFEPSEFFSNDETASSIQRLRESVHSEKMRFFDGAEK
ncbi:protein AHNAK2-like isoform X34 [Hippocampus zosterae]|uniref:protein AHNAK2-like isoform X34 n=1 Tax=Hippocampus zosterae TaxID=109293 RepID=UPI00223D5A51|nr:protein AHNAK2-like isoform X34 [Hippocampus zosterae]